jgi:hypothetical protein
LVVTISHGLSLGLFIVVCTIVVWFFRVIGLSLAGEIARMRRGEIRLSDMSEMGQWLYLTFFNDDGDGPSGFA